MHSKSDKIEIIINDKAKEVIKKFFDSLKNRYQNNLESMNGKEFVIGYVHLLYQNFHKINPNFGGSYIDSPDWIKYKKTTINLINTYQKIIKIIKRYQKIKDAFNMLKQQR